MGRPTRATRAEASGSSPPTAGPVEVLARPDAGSHFWDPCWLPDGRSADLQRAVRAFRAWASSGWTWTTRTVSPFEGARGPRLSRSAALRGSCCATRAPGVGAPRAAAALMRYCARTRGVGGGSRTPTELLYPTWTRDGRSFCGLDLEAEPDRVLLVRHPARRDPRRDRRQPAPARGSTSPGSASTPTTTRSSCSTAPPATSTPSTGRRRRDPSTASPNAAHSAGEGVPAHEAARG